MMTSIFGEVEDWFHREHHQPYNAPDSPTAPEATVSLLDTIRSEVASAVAWGEDEFRRALPTVAKVADDAEALASSVPAQAVLGAVLSPADEALIVGLVQRLDQAAHAAEGHEAAPSAQVEQENLHAGDVFTPVPAGPVVGGQAQ